ncbi:LruC domain-containing protein [Emticicia aquatilis]|uniref:LruC domain-containing protein n=2 Tax=Emticicia aquatilis TaxID=1537369 RepID=A0A916YSC2_9BACT|nr:LruC domain-containing protein [Emticicia aquatilis]
MKDNTSANTSAAAIENLNISPDFNFKTSEKVAIKVSIFNGQDKPLKSIPFSIVTEPNGEVIFSGMTNQNGMLEFTKELGNHIKQISFKTDIIGVPNSLTVNIQNNKATFQIGGSVPATNMFVEDSNSDNAREIYSEQSNGLPDFKTLGSWNTAGVPKYLEPVNESITSEFMQDITASLPESKPLTSSHPDYLKNDKPTTLIITEKADVWITFVHEGAGWLNSLGFYTFDPKNPPQKVDDLKNLTMVFPNVSYSGSGGGLVAGNKVKIGTFDTGTGIGFVLLANAFKDGKVGSAYYPHFSHSNLNTESNADLRRHFVLLDDSKSNRMLLAVEDVSRENKPIGCDNDFNDAVFFVTSNPVKAIENPAIPKMDTFKDSDGDGVGDTRDEFPNDPNRAFTSYTPSKTTFASLAYEDLWPSKGDYDFNDLVLDYQVQEVYNANNQVVDVKVRTVVRAVGASLKNGWGIQLPIEPSAIKKVSGQSLKNGYIKTLANGTEAEQSNAVIMIFDDAFNQIRRVGADFVNTVEGQPYSKGDTLNVAIEFASPIASSKLGTAPYNPFLVVNYERGKEIHLPNYAPTDKADAKLFGTSHDRSNPAKNTYYKNWKNLPWAIQVPVSFDYPYEKQEILKGHLMFSKWAESGGTQYADWYLDKTGYRSKANIYTK